jgi:hypothetical protein
MYIWHTWWLRDVVSRCGVESPFSWIEQTRTSDNYSILILIVDVVDIFAQRLTIHLI